MIEDRFSLSAILDPRSCGSLSLLVRRVFTAKTTEFLELQALRRFLLVFGGDVIAIFAIATLQNDVVSHKFSRFQVSGFRFQVSGIAPD
jgi:hypothetical protein